MSDIKPGDLVMVVRPTPCCGNTRYIGRIFTVSSIERGTWVCHYCHKTHFNDIDVAAISDEQGCAVSRLKKVDPLTEGDSLPTRRELEVTV